MIGFEHYQCSFQFLEILRHYTVWNISMRSNINPTQGGATIFCRLAGSYLQSKPLTVLPELIIQPKKVLLAHSEYLQNWSFWSKKMRVHAQIWHMSKAFASSSLHHRHPEHPQHSRIETDLGMSQLCWFIDNDFLLELERIQEAEKIEQKMINNWCPEVRTEKTGDVTHL